MLGSNKYGDLGIGTRSDDVRILVHVHGVPCGATLMPGSRCAVTGDGAAYCWGIWSGDGSDKIHEEGVDIPGQAAGRRRGLLARLEPHRWQ